MLKLNYIIADILPEHELHYLKSNLEKDKRESTGENWQLVLLFEEKKRLEDFPAEESLFISMGKGCLQKAVSLGMATLGYLPVVEADTELCAEAEEESKVELCAETETKCTMYTEGFEEIDFVFLNHVYERHHNLPWTILKTDRCFVREFSMDYLDELFEMYAGEGMTDYMEPLYDYEEEKKYQQAYIEHMYRFYGYGMWIVCDKKTGKLIGRAGVEHREELEGELELGYAIAVPYRRKGYATEVTRAILTYVKEELEMSCIYCLIEEGNRVSICFAEKLGFSFEETLDISDKKMKKYVLVLKN